MSVPTILVLVAGVLAVIEAVRSKGQSLVAWAVLLIAIALVWGKFG
jgi:hypothetical protein